VDIAQGLQSYIYGQADSTLQANGLPSLSKGGGMSVPGYSLQASASSSAKGQSGDISGGTAFNIGGINLGTQYPSAATAGGGNPAESLVGATGLGPYLIPLALVGVGLALVLILRR
jgi:hypothetical protein